MCEVPADATSRGAYAPRLAGWQPLVACDTIRYMNSKRYTWDDETKDDSPSEFVTTTYATTSAALHSNWPRDRRRRRRAARRNGLLWVMLAAVGASGLVLYGVSHWLRA